MVLLCVPTPTRGGDVEVTDVGYGVESLYQSTDVRRVRPQRTTTEISIVRNPYQDWGVKKTCNRIVPDINLGGGDDISRDGVLPTDSIRNFTFISVGMKVSNTRDVRCIYYGFKFRTREFSVEFSVDPGGRGVDPTGSSLCDLMSLVSRFHSVRGILGEGFDKTGVPLP